MMNQPSTRSGHQQQNQNHTIVPMPQHQVSAARAQEKPPQPNRPSLELLLGKREEYIKFAVPLYEAAMKGDWKAAEPILSQHPHLIRAAITENEETLLHVAASAESTKAVEQFVINLVQLMEKPHLELQNKNWDTALCSAAAAGNIETAETMVKKNRALIEIPNSNNVMPLYMAALFAKPKMVAYLYNLSNKMVGDFWKNDNRGWVLQKCVEADMFDVALNILNDCPDIILQKGLLSEVLLALAQKPRAFEEEKTNSIFTKIKSIFAAPNKKESAALELLKIIWEKVAKMDKKDINDIIRGPRSVKTNEGKVKEGYFSRVLFVAAKMGNTRFIIELIRSYPDLIWKHDDKGKTIFHFAVKFRQIEVFKLIYEIGAMKDLITPIKDENHNNMLHIVAKSVKQQQFENASGVAFQMQSELLWFQEVQKMIPPQYRQRENKKGKTPKELFTKEHEALLKDGREWMRDTASQCMVVATLIATIVFAAAFTLPGGYDQNTGIPFFRKEASLIIFVISDAISLICSSTSVLMFLSILTSRYAEYDFKEALPRKLVNGIATLFLSIVTMMIAFSASFFVLYHNKMRWIPITVTALASIPVMFYIFLQLDLFKDVVKAAYHSKHMFKPNKKRTLYY
ncbi:putative ankyrin repeat-containing domain, PGG domain, ankyrin repeat-containing domain superfamily [Helianthus debilis subsp. tardiflorus]